MKRIILLLLLVITYSLSKGQLSQTLHVNLKIEDGSYAYDTVLTSTYKKDIIYSNLKNWADIYFVSSRAAIQQDDKESGELFLKSSFTTIYGTNNDSQARVGYKCRIYIKDNKIKVIITAITIDQFDDLVTLIKLRPQYYLHPVLLSSDLEFNNLVNAINNTINKKPESDF